MKSIKIYFSLLTFLLTYNAFSQYTEVINSNRPGVSRSAFSVGTNVAQLEVGPYTIKEKHTPLNYEVSGFGIDFSARYGLLFEELEINIEGTYQNDKRKLISRSGFTSEDKRSNFKNFAIGAKYLVYDPYKNAGEEKPNLYSYHANRTFKWKSLIPAVAVYVGANFDTKNNPFTAPDVEGFSPKIMVATQNNFSGGWVFVMNFVKDRIGSDFSDFQYILTLTHSFNPRWAIFGETQGIKSDFYADNLFRFGGGYLLSKDFQLDTAVTLNTKDTPSVFGINFGASYRLDFHKDKKIDNNNDKKDADKRKPKSKKKKRKKKKDDVDFDDDGSL
ncbi:transporter [Ichthyenterobacterium magnum]|uniref:Outer membrane putative beta-barrel porin/alpha-amylase n=1 Tax=Ichthyenterobacterium magnum TaxID=1230530 RepID=A0A420DLS4_9FLAO|nr:transporter [Ichthyenterobacterium magnum]RKE95234.1 outer membrane putative beta-barrel porin/alpha-amylase [Ichthyenterobacterium magnum]